MLFVEWTSVCYVKETTCKAGGLIQLFSVRHYNNDGFKYVIRKSVKKLFISGSIVGNLLFKMPGFWLKAHRNDEIVSLRT